MEVGEAEGQMVGLNENGSFVDFVDGWLVKNAQETQQIKLRKHEKVKVTVLYIVLFILFCDLSKSLG